MKEIMMEDASLGKLPLVDAERDQDHDANDQRCEHWGSTPGENAPTKVQSSQEQSQAGGEKCASGKVESTKLLPNGQMIQAGVSLRRPVPNKESDGSCPPKCHLNPLQEESAHSDMKGIINRNYVEIAPASVLICLR